MAAQCPIWYLTLDELPILLLSSGCEFRAVEAAACHANSIATAGASCEKKFILARDTRATTVVEAAVPAALRKIPHATRVPLQFKNKTKTPCPSGSCRIRQGVLGERNEVFFE